MFMNMNIMSICIYYIHGSCFCCNRHPEGGLLVTWKRYNLDRKLLIDNGIAQLQAFLLLLIDFEMLVKESMASNTVICDNAPCHVRE
jgi:hypothetical protein